MPEVVIAVRRKWSHEVDLVLNADGPGPVPGRLPDDLDWARLDRLARGLHSVAG